MAFRIDSKMIAADGHEDTTVVQRITHRLPDLYVEDETAWLEAMADLIGRRAYADLDYASLREYLTDMAKRDRREVESRLVVLLLHLLKWSHQPGHRSPSWHGSIIEQRHELGGLLGRGVLRNHAEVVLADAYAKAVERAVAETRLPATTFPPACPYTVDDLLSGNHPAGSDGPAGDE